MRTRPREGVKAEEVILGDIVRAALATLMKGTGGGMRTDKERITEGDDPVVGAAGAVGVHRAHRQAQFFAAPLPLTVGAPRPG